ncbi:MAG TPA: AAA family ATPase [Kofleriaceae bacterium]|nr:AAA family ATPase [Kofleriaceae bacterium]
MTTELRPDELFRSCDPHDLPFESTASEPEPVEVLGQDRALEAARFAIGIRHDGYNLFALGPHGVGKHTTLRQLLEREAAHQPPPADWCHVNNFAEPRRPRALRLPAGTAARLRADMERAVAELRVAMPAAFDSEEYRNKKLRLGQDFQRRHEAGFEELHRRAHDRRIAVAHTESGFALAAIRGDEVIDPEAFARLPEPEQKELRAAMEQVGAELTELLRKLHDWARDQLEALKALDRETAAAVARRVLDATRAGYLELPAVLAYLTEVENDVIESADRFLARAETDAPEALLRMLHQHGGEERFRRYAVNVMVDHSSSHGAPVVYEDNPTHANLIGRIEHVAELGALITEFTLIRPGALHRANGGYLLLDAIKLLQPAFAWDALKRALRTREVRIESIGQALGLATTVSLEPESIPLDVKVVLLGDRLLYYLLAAYDPEFVGLFKVMADFEQDIDRSRDAHIAYARLIAGLVRNHKLRPFDRDAVARAIEHASRLASDGEKLSLHMRSIIDLLQEADHRAGSAGHATATADDVQVAIDAQLHRAGRVRERMLEAIHRGTVLIDTSGATVGQINGLSVIDLGGQAFGHPTRITARARLGDGKVIDIEREVELGGPIHSKGVLILGGLLGARYAQHLPLSLSATIVFEQSYGGVEGDSASAAELCALLSAIAEVPIRQSLAVTGSVNQHGDLQPIGGVNEKIEGFFDVCRDRGLTGEQGVVIPRGNMRHLMLRKDVVAAVAADTFHVHAASTIDEAIELVTGRTAGARDHQGQFPVGSVNALVEARLVSFAEDARRFLNVPERSAAISRVRRWS